MLSSRFSALGRAVGDETCDEPAAPGDADAVSVLSVEPWGMKRPGAGAPGPGARVSVLSVEPWGMKPRRSMRYSSQTAGFSALGRAVGDETVC